LWWWKTTSIVDAVRSGVDARDIPWDRVSSEKIRAIEQGQGTHSGLTERALMLFITPMFEPFDAVQIRVSLDEIEPAIWRRLVLPSSWTLDKLHLGIQAAFNWWNCHLHEFQIGGLRYGDAAFLMEDSRKDDPQVFESRGVRLRDFRRGSRFTYLYDFGDDWSHTIEIEEFLALDPKPKQGSCIDGARARPPEDVGGANGYERFLEIIRDETDPRHDEMRRWAGGHFDPDWFDHAMVDKDVENALHASVQRRLYQPKPRRPRRR
jgi:hypothetical protein